MPAGPAAGSSPSLRNAASRTAEQASTGLADQVGKATDGRPLLAVGTLAANVQVLKAASFTGEKRKRTAHKAAVGAREDKGQARPLRPFLSQVIGMGVIPGPVSLAQALAANEEEGVVGISECRVSRWLDVMFEGEQDLQEEVRVSG